MIDLDLFFRYLNIGCHGIQFCGKNGKFRSFVAVVFRNGIGHHYVNVHINSVNGASISSKNIVNSRVDIAHLWTFGTTRQKLTYPAEYLRIYWTDFYDLFTTWKRFAATWSGPLFLITQGTLPWQPILGEIHKMTFIRQAGVPKRMAVMILKCLVAIYSSY